jgi:hypothetical protein
MMKSNFRRGLEYTYITLLSVVLVALTWVFCFGSLPGVKDSAGLRWFSMGYILLGVTWVALASLVDWIRERIPVARGRLGAASAAGIEKASNLHARSSKTLAAHFSRFGSSQEGHPVRSLSAERP